LQPVTRNSQPVTLSLKLRYFCSKSEDLTGSTGPLELKYTALPASGEAVVLRKPSLIQWKSVYAFSDGGISTGAEIFEQKSAKNTKVRNLNFTLFEIFVAFCD
jgi:hypothetical protein